MSIVSYVILVSGSLYYSSYLKNIFLVPLLILLISLYIYKNFKLHIDDIKINKNKIMYLLAALALIFVNANLVLTSSLVLVTCLICGILITELLSYEKFAKYYINLIIILSIGSWIYYPIIKYDILSPFPDFHSLDGILYSNFILFGIYRDEIPWNISLNNYIVSRNSGIFWEPGAFQMFVNIAYLLSIVIKRINIKIYLIFFVTQLSIASTAGVIVFFMISMVNWIRIKKSNLNRRVLKLFLISGFIVLTFTSNLYSTLGNKFVSGSEGNSSFIARSTDYIIDLKILIDNILIGVGYGNIKIREDVAINYMGIKDYYSENMPPAADGLLLYLSYVGIFGLIILIPLIYPAQIRKWSNAQKLIIIFSLVIMYNNENFLAYLLPWTMLFYGLDPYRNKD